MRPLDRIGSLKLKLGVVIVAAVATTVVVLELGRRAGWPTAIAAAIAMTVALALVQVLAHGMTSPLREMARAATRLADGDGHAPVTATSRDEVGDLARAFNHMADQVAETDRLRRDLVANAAHELRTPLAALRALTENLVDGVETADQDALGVLLGQVERLHGLVEQLLDLSRLEAGVAALERRTVDLRDVVAAAAEVVRTADPHARITLPELARAVPADVDELRLQQVVVNLLTNARRHAPAGTPVAVELVAGDDDQVELAVVDAGPGVVDADRARVFERFHRGDADRAGNGGSGLGLAISREIVDRHGGRLEVDEDHPHGCRMVVTLPAVAAAHP